MRSTKAIRGMKCGDARRHVLLPLAIRRRAPQRRFATGLRMAARSALSLEQVPQGVAHFCCLVSGDPLRHRADFVPEPVDVATATHGVWSMY